MHAISGVRGGVRKMRCARFCLPLMIPPHVASQAIHVSKAKVTPSRGRLDRTPWTGGDARPPPLPTGLRGTDGGCGGGGFGAPSTAVRPSRLPSSFAAEGGKRGREMRRAERDASQREASGLP